MNDLIGKIEKMILSLGLTALVLLTGVSQAAAQTSLAAQETSIPGGVLVLVTYLVLWGLFGGYLFMIMRRQRALQRDLEGLDDRIDEVLGESVGDPG